MANSANLAMSSSRARPKGLLISSQASVRTFRPRKLPRSRPFNVAFATLTRRKSAQRQDRPREGRAAGVGWDGNSVPLKIYIESPMTAGDHVKTMYVFSQIRSQSVRFHLGPRLV